MDLRDDQIEQVSLLVNRSAHIAEHCFSFLDAPVIRCASLDTAIPMDKGLEDNFLAKARIGEKLNALLNY